MRSAEEWNRALGAVRAYGIARQAFCEAQAALPDLLPRNDNKVGVCGEFWAMKHYVSEGYAIAELPPTNNAGYDFTAVKEGLVVRVSVKVVSDESIEGRQAALKPSEAWDHVLYVLLGTNMIPYRFGRVTRADFENAKRSGLIGGSPIVSRSSCNPTGWVACAGKVWNPEESLLGASASEIVVRRGRKNGS